MPCFFVFFCSCELRGIDIQLSVQHLMNCGTAGTCKGWSSKFFTGLLRGGGGSKGRGFPKVLRVSNTCFIFTPIWGRFWRAYFSDGLKPPTSNILLMEEIMHQLIGRLSHYLQGSLHPRWCRISAINSSHRKMDGWNTMVSFWDELFAGAFAVSFRDGISLQNCPSGQISHQLLRLFVLWSLGCPPSQDSSHHQDYETFLVGDPYKPSFATVTGRGDNPIWSWFWFLMLFDWSF